MRGDRLCSVGHMVVEYLTIVRVREVDDSVSSSLDDVSYVVHQRDLSEQPL